MHPCRYVINGFLLLVPMLIWNIIFIPYLPPFYSKEIFWNNIPVWLGVFEKALKIIVFILPILMIPEVKNKIQKIGLFWYIFGTIIYFVSWVVLIYYPYSEWSKSLFGHIAPALFPLFIFIGISLIGIKNFIDQKSLHLVYILLSTLFVLLHCYHVFIVHNNLN